MINARLDRKIRKEMAEHYARATEILNLRSADSESPGVWVVAPGSSAESDAGVSTRMWSFLVAEINDKVSDGPGESNLPLTISRALLETAAGGLAAIAELTVSRIEPARLAGIGSLSRSVAEHAGTAHWIVSGSDRDTRLRRAILVELNGIRQLLRYLPDARVNRDASDLEAAYAHFTEIARENFTNFDDGKPIRIDGKSMPNLTDRVVGVIGREQYAELNVFTHPTGYLSSTYSHGTSGAHRQTAFVRRSTLHDESRLGLAAATAYAFALVGVAAYISAPIADTVGDWLGACGNASDAWCEANGCI